MEDSFPVAPGWSRFQKGLLEMVAQLIQGETLKLGAGGDDSEVALVRADRDKQP